MDNQRLWKAALRKNVGQIYPASVAGRVPGQGDSIPAIIGGYGKPPYEKM